jgi:hypothetical protein
VAACCSLLAGVGQRLAWDRDSGDSSIASNHSGITSFEPGKPGLVRPGSGVPCSAIPRFRVDEL